MSFHPAQFNIIHEDRAQEENSFVGIRRNGTGTPDFVLPPGFDDFPASDPKAVREYFFKLFRALRCFRQFYLKHHSEEDEGDFAGDRGIRISVKESEPAMLYSKIQKLEEILERYDELRIYNILYRNRRTEEIDYSQIHRYLDQAVYQDDIPYVEEMRLSRPVREVEASTLVRMFCFIYSEVAPHVGNKLSPQVKAEASRFKSQHLAPNSALFGAPEVHSQTIDRLKKTLDEIDREVAYKGEDYWYFFEAVETFLYGELDEEEEGISWGITKFAPVWEDMCMVWLYHNRWDGVVYADSERYANDHIGGHDLFIDESFDPPFTFELNGHERHMRPDVVRKQEKSPQNLFLVKDQGKGRVKVSIREDSKSRKTGDLMKRLRDEIKEGPMGDVTNETKDQKYSHVFYGVSEGNIKSYIEFVGREEDMLNNITKLVDFKCVSPRAYQGSNLNNKTERDKVKQLTYEYALQLNNDTMTESQICVPNYFRKIGGHIGKPVHKSKLNQDIKSQEIEVLKVDFESIIENYIMGDNMKAEIS